MAWASPDHKRGRKAGNGTENENHEFNIFQSLYHSHLHTDTYTHANAQTEKREAKTDRRTYSDSNWTGNKSVRAGIVWLVS